MRRLIAIVAALLVWQMSDARPIPEAQARRNAAEFFTAERGLTKAAAVRAEDLRLVYTFPESVTKAPADPALYVFDMPSGGYVIAAGDDVARKVLAYSFEDAFPVGNIPVNMMDGLKWYADIIAFARSQGWVSSATKADEEEPEEPVVLKTAKWNQFSPFNDLAPKIDGQKPPIGCVATATAIIMKYHRWPEKGVGTIPAYDFGGGHISPIQLGHTYDWSLMPDKAKGYNAQESEQIARLLYDVAVMYKMNFDLEGSGAYTQDAYHLTEYFGYDKQMKIEYREEVHSQKMWEQKMKDEINADRPILYAGYSEEGGHAFVIDGYDGRFFSINYGWGQGSAFFTFAPIEGHEEDMTEFYDGQTAVVNIKPDEGGEPQYNLHLSDAVLTPSFDLGQNTKFTLERCYFYLDSFIPSTDNYVKVTLCFALYDSKGAFKEQISKDHTMEVDMYRWYEIVPQECMIAGGIADGDRIALAVKDEASGAWVPYSLLPYDCIVFTKRPLSSLIEVGYAQDQPEGMQKALNGESLYLYFRTQKDIPWAIFPEGSSKPVVWRSHWDYFEEGRAMACEIYEDDEEDPFETSYIWLPTGNYTAIFRNPLTGEELTLHLEL